MTDRYHKHVHTQLAAANAEVERLKSVSDGGVLVAGRLMKLTAQQHDALDRCKRMSEGLLKGRPVRDVSETLAEVECALAAYRKLNGEL